MEGRAPDDRSAPAPRAEGPRAEPWELPLRLWSLLVFAAWAAGPFVAAGSLRWWPGWSHLLLLGVAVAAHGAFVRKRNPALRARRRRIGPGTKRWDLAWNALVWPLFAAIALAAGFDWRGHGPTLPVAAWPAGAALLLAGFALSAAAMAENPFFEGTVRVEAGQRVVDTGPYRHLRHPGYAGLAAWALATPLLCLSLRALPAAAAAAAWIALRTALEDAALRRELPGYAEYARRVRFRLLPGLW